MSHKTVKQTIDPNQININAWLAIPNSWTAEMVARAGYDIVTIDMQHGLIDYQVALSMLQAISSTNVPALVRVPWNDPGILMKVLDAGAAGVICPMINTKEEAEQFIGACRYPPLGYRSYGPLRAINLDRDYFKTANSKIIVLAMIETKQALENIDEIISVEGIDGFYIGTMDLSISLGIKDLGELKNPTLKNAIDLIVSKAKGKGLIVGMHSRTIEDLPLLRSWEFNIITSINDSKLLNSSATIELRNTKDELMEVKS